MRTITSRIAMIVAGMYLIVVAGCGGSGGSGTAASGVGTTAIHPITNATISYYVSNSSISPLVGLQFNVYLPTGVTVATDQGTKNVKATSLIAGSALSGQPILGTYSSPILKLVISPTTAAQLQNGFSAGEILKVNYALATETNFTLDTFKAANNSTPIPKNNLVGYSYNLTTKKLADITSSLTPSFTVAFSSYSGSK
jgi:hypothetical protein